MSETDRELALDLGDVLALVEDANHVLTTVVDHGMPGLVRGASGVCGVHLIGASDRLTRAWGDVVLATTALRTAVECQGEGEGLS